MKYYFALLILSFAAGSASGQALPITTMNDIARDETLLAGGAAPGDPFPANDAGDVPFIRVIDDPLEPLNRAFYGFNRMLLRGFYEPIEKVYSTALPAPARRSLGRAAHNLKYPGRLINMLLQGRLIDAGRETGRFTVNTTAGALGLFDPAAHLGMPRTDEDFGKTFARYGAGPGFFFMIPVLGPSNLRDGLATPLDAVTNPATFIFASQLFLINDLSFSLPQIERVNAMERDPYAASRDIWALDRLRRVRDGVKPDLASEPHAPVPTLKAAFVRPNDPKFITRAAERSARIPATGRNLPYSFWGQRKPAPLLFIVSGLGAHRLSDFAIALAESAWERGFAVVTVSNPTNWEFIERAGSRDVPGYTPVDAADLHEALGAIALDLGTRYPGRFTSTGLVGLSLGGLQALFIAEAQSAGKAPDGLRLDRIVSIAPPVDLVYALHQLDEYYLAPRAWPEPQRRPRMENALLKAMGLAGQSPDEKASLPFSAVESQYLIGYFYRMILQQIICSSQSKKDLGVIKGGLGRWNRQAAYRQVEKFSFTDYVRQIVLPYYLNDGLHLTREEFIRRASLHWLEPALQADARVRVFVNADDFLLGPADLDWLRRTLGDRLTVFDDGGHLGNLCQARVKDQVLEAFNELWHKDELKQFKVVQSRPMVVK